MAKDGFSKPWRRRHDDAPWLLRDRGAHGISPKRTHGAGTVLIDPPKQPTCRRHSAVLSHGYCSLCYRAIADVIDRLTLEAPMCDQVAQALIESPANAGPFDGGCRIFANALLRAFGSGTLVRIVSQRGGGQTEHYGAKLHGVVVDFAGPAISPTAWVERFASAEHLEKETLSAVDGDDPETSISEDRTATTTIAELIAPLVLDTCPYLRN